MPARTQRALRVLAATLLPNLPLWFLRLRTGISPGLFNIDFLLATAACLWLGPITAVIVFVVILLTEYIRYLNTVYFFSIEDFAYLTRFIGDVKPTLLAEHAAVIILGVGISVWIWLRLLPPRTGTNRERLTSLVPTTLLLLAFLAIDTMRGANPVVSGMDARSGTMHLATETMVRVWKPLLRLALAPRIPPREVTAATDRLRRRLADGNLQRAHPNVVLVLVESMGEWRDPRIASVEFAPFRTPAVLSTYNETGGDVPFSGSTVPGEIRELCGIASGVRIDGTVLGKSPHCLPDRFAAAGYRTLSLHGNRGSMFQRERWHRQLGFDQSLFRDSLQAVTGRPLCRFAFTAVCDGVVADYLHQRLLATRNGPPLFVHWITIDTHLPIDTSGYVPDPTLPALPAAAGEQLTLLRATLSSVAHVAADPALPPTIFVIVGDHRPPFAARNELTPFVPDRVPYLILEPRAAQLPPLAAAITPSKRRLSIGYP